MTDISPTPKLRVLVACEFSGVVRKAFAERGYDAWSCDLLPSRLPGHHILGNVLNHLNEGWDLMIAHPPCTWLCRAMRTNAARKDRPLITENFESERQNAFDFVMALANAPIKRIAIENPIGYLNSAWRKPDQIVYPYMLGQPYRKDICFWLKNLPKLYPPVCLFPPKPWRKLDFWSTKRNQNGESLKSITFTGIAEAMADQWGSYLMQEVRQAER